MCHEVTLAGINIIINVIKILVNLIIHVFYMVSLLILLVLSQLLTTFSLLNDVIPTIDISSISNNGYFSTNSHGSVIDETSIYIAGGWNGNS